MPDFPNGYQPTTKAEKEIAQVMSMAHRVFLAMQEQFPDLPVSAISVGFINLGVQIDIAHCDRNATAGYLRSLADLIQRPN